MVQPTRPILGPRRCNFGYNRAVTTTAEQAYLFRHALVRDAAYELQLPRDRALLHGMVVDVFEQVVAARPELRDSTALAVADHALNAAQLPDQQQRYLRKELEYLERALEHAKRRFAHATTVMVGNRMLTHKLLPVELAGKIAHAVGMAQMFMGEVEHAAVCFSQSAERAVGRLDRVRAITAEADMYRNLARHADAERLFRQALELVGPEDGASYAEALRQLSATYLMQGRLEDGEPLLHEARETSLAAGDISGAARCEINLGIVRMHTGRPAESEQAFLQARKLAEQAGDLGTIALAGENLGTLFTHINRTPEAEPHFQHALKLARQLGNRPLLASILTNLGDARTDTGKYAEAEAILNQALALHRETGNLAKQALTLGALAVAFFRSGRDEEAVRLTRECIAMHQLSGNRHAECAARINLSDSLFMDGRCADALAEVQAAAELAEQVKDPRLLGYTICHRVMIEAKRDAAAPDLKAWARGLELIRQAGDPAAATRLEAELARMVPPAK